MENVTIASHGDSFCIPCGTKGGFTCLGFDVCMDRTTRLAEWLGRPDLKPVQARGTLESYDEYRQAMQAALARCERENIRCPVELTPQLIGLEGTRVEVVDRFSDKPRRFNVGKSTGWLPIHLEIHSRRSMGGMPAMGPYKSLRVIRSA